MTGLGGVGRILLLVGAVTVVLGLVLVVADRIPGVGRLPGDIVIKRPNLTVYIPLGTSILVSIVVSLLLWLVGRR